MEQEINGCVNKKMITYEFAQCSYCIQIGLADTWIHNLAEEI